MNRSSDIGVCSDGLRICTLPAASAGPELPDRHHQRVVPRADAGDDADRLAPDHRRVALDVLAGGLALEVACGAGEEAEVVGAERHLLARAIEIGLPTLRDSICASSSAFSSITSASFEQQRATRSPGVASSHSGSACFAVLDRPRRPRRPSCSGTESIVSAVAGLMTSEWLPWGFSYSVRRIPLSRVRRCASATGMMVSGQDQEDDDVHLRQLLAEADLAEDPDRERVLRARRERRHDHLVERQRECEQPAGDQRGRDASGR